ncbi:Sec-independent protein translocase protein TatB, partial [Burkholderia thailandensis]
MLDLGLSKMALIGVVALVVLGPERLPRVARTAGALFGRAQRYINDVKAEVSREIELDALRTMKSDFEQAARNVENTIHDNLREHERDLNAAWNSAVSSGDPAAADASGGLGATSDEPSW